MIYNIELNRIASELRELRNNLKKELNSLPAGELYVTTCRGVKCYYERHPKKGRRRKEHRRGIKKDKQKVMRLIRKKYIVRTLPLIDENLKRIEELLRYYRPVDENSVMERFIEKNPELSEGIYHENHDLTEWAKGESSIPDFHSEELKSTASDGTKRRSLGELLIGTKLEQYGIPYRYEAELDHPDLNFAPDFTIIRPKDGKIIYWEHIGKVNDEDYLSYNKYKFAEYEKYGIVPWDNLIITYSQKDSGVNVRLIDALIHAWLL